MGLFAPIVFDFAKEGERFGRPLREEDGAHGLDGQIKRTDGWFLKKK
jgi:hypothetical protein